MRCQKVSCDDCLDLIKVMTNPRLTEEHFSLIQVKFQLKGIRIYSSFVEIEFS